MSKNDKKTFLEVLELTIREEESTEIMYISLIMMFLFIFASKLNSSDIFYPIKLEYELLLQFLIVSSTVIFLGIFRLTEKRIQRLEEKIEDTKQSTLN